MFSKLNNRNSTLLNIVVLSYLFTIIQIVNSLQTKADNQNQNQKSGIIASKFIVNNNNSSEIRRNLPPPSTNGSGEKSKNGKEANVRKVSSSSTKRVSRRSSTAVVGSENENKYLERIFQQGDLQQQQSQQQNSQQQNYHPISSDSWHPHNIMPTFTDQEQGDEMVALASESEVEQVKIMPIPIRPTNISSNLYNTNNNNNNNNNDWPAKDLLQLDSNIESNSPFSKQSMENNDKQSATTSFSSNLNNNNSNRSNKDGATQRQQHRLIEDYYSDNVDDDDIDQDLIVDQVNSSSVAESNKKQALKGEDKKERNSKFAAASKDMASHYSDYVGASAAYEEQQRQPISFVNDNIDNNTYNKSIKASDKGWLPASPSPTTTTTTTTMTSGGLGRQTGEKLAELFGKVGGSSPFSGGNLASKADMAIEYFKNVLKDKQQQNNKASDGLYNIRQYDSKQQDKNVSLHRLTSFATRLNQIMLDNNKTLFGSGLEQSFNESSSSSHDKRSFPSSGKVFLAQQADVKFSISDVKPTISTFEYQPPSHTTIFLPTSTTKIPFNQQQQQQQQQLTDQKVSNNQQRTPSIHFLGGGSIDSPMSADYMDSMEEYSGGSYSRPEQNNNHQHQQQRLFGLESQSVPMTVQNVFIQSHEKTPTNLNEAIALNEQQQYQELKQHQHQHQHQQIPTTNRFFQMHQPFRIPQQQSSYPEIQKQQQFQKQSSTVEQPHSIEFNLKQTDNKDNRTEVASSKKVEETQQIIQQIKSDQPEMIGIKQQQANVEPTPAPITSKLYRDTETQLSQPVRIIDNHQNQQQQQNPNPSTIIVDGLSNQGRPVINGFSSQQQYQSQQQQGTKMKPPKIVSYNYFGSNQENNAEQLDSSPLGELLATNYQLGDALYSSSGGLEQALSQTELEAIQSQFLTAEHPIVPLPDYPQTTDQSQNRHHQQQQRQQNHNQDNNLVGLLANLNPSKYNPNFLQKLSSPEKQAEDSMKELASNQELNQMNVVPPPPLPPTPHQHQANIQQAPINVRPVDSHNINNQQQQSQNNYDQEHKRMIKSFHDVSSPKKKSLIVYLNHPRPVDMSKISGETSNFSHDSTDNTNPSIGDFISAKEFDSQGLSKDNKYFDVSNLHNSSLDGTINQSQADKEGLSVVVIGDAYKYKKIVLLISSKSGGLKFIPMVKDMKK